MDVIKLDNSIFDISLDFFEEYYSKEPHLLYLREKTEHYRLLVYLSYIKNNMVILDLGTHNGASALALACNNTNTVVSYDIDPKDIPYKGNVHNIQFIKDDIFSISREMIANTDIVLLDISPHEGQMEKKFVNLLSEYGFGGLLVCDDIHLNQEMRDFWNSICLSKVDATVYGHFSGTGLVDYSGKIKFELT